MIESKGSSVAFPLLTKDYRQMISVKRLIDQKSILLLSGGMLTTLESF